MSGLPCLPVCLCMSVYKFNLSGNVWPIQSTMFLLEGVFLGSSAFRWHQCHIPCMPFSNFLPFALRSWRPAEGVILFHEHSMVFCFKVAHIHAYCVYYSGLHTKKMKLRGKHFGLSNWKSRGQALIWFWSHSLWQKMTSISVSLREIARFLQRNS